jgi:RNA polymerase sigma-70 factor, ECF subfamily
VTQTTQSLLTQLREQPDNAEAWRRFDMLYRPMLQNWLQRYCLQPHDADDLVQQTLEVVVRELPHFHYDSRKGTFPAWLRAILHNRLREYWRSRDARPLATGDSDFNDQILNQLVNHRNDPDRAWDREHARHVAQRLLSQIKPDCSPTTWLAFRRLMGGSKAPDVAAELKTSVNAVYLAKSSVLSKLRQAMQGLPD